jgi:hypothetical protein
VTGTELVRLTHPVYVRSVGKGLGNGLPTVAVNDHKPSRLQAACNVDDVTEQRLAREAVQNLRDIGAHALAHAGREDDDIQRGFPVRTELSAQLRKESPGISGRDAQDRCPPSRLRGKTIESATRIALAAGFEFNREPQSGRTRAAVGAARSARQISEFALKVRSPDNTVLAGIADWSLRRS